MIRAVRLYTHPSRPACPGNLGLRLVQRHAKIKSCLARRYIVPVVAFNALLLLGLLAYLLSR